MMAIRCRRARSPAATQTPAPAPPQRVAAAPFDTDFYDAVECRPADAPPRRYATPMAPSRRVRLRAPPRHIAFLCLFIDFIFAALMPPPPADARRRRRR